MKTASTSVRVRACRRRRRTCPARQARQSWSDYQKVKEGGLGRDKRQDASDISDGLASMAFDETVNALDTLTNTTSAVAAEQAQATYAHAKVVLAAKATLVPACAGLITRRLLGQPAAGRPPPYAGRGNLSTPIHVKAGTRPADGPLKASSSA
jgi:hypothetical protein